MKNQKGFTVVEALLIFIIVGILGGAGWYVYNSNQKTNDSLTKADSSSSETTSTENDKSCEQPGDWKEFINPEYKHSYYFPGTHEAVVLDGLGGNYGDLVSDPNNSETNLFTLDVLLWPGGTTLGNANGGADAFKKAMNEGGVKAVAQLSQKINKEDENPNIVNKKVSNVKSFNICKGEAWGFTVTKGFTTSFIKSEGSGHILDNETTVVYVGNGTSIYLAEFQTNSADAAKILSSIKLP